MYILAPEDIEACLYVLISCKIDCCGIICLFDCTLFSPSFLQDTDGTIVDRGYKRVAIVQDFFDIIYDVHVETDGRGGKHAGQKRTYKAVSLHYDCWW